MEVLIGYLIAINVISFLVYRRDKMHARKRERRIPEKTLLTVAVIGGSVGAFVGMRVYHHKTQKMKFYLGVPIILFAQIILVLIIIKVVLLIA